MSSANNKLSTLAPSQLPAFVQDDYQTFVAFLQAYYEYLEQQGKLSWANEQLEQAWDVDQTLDAFLDKFKEQYLNQFPSDILADRAMMIKNIKQFYLSKGSEKSIKFLFRALFGEDITILYPNRSILRVSDGKWIKEQALRITGNILNIYTGDGKTNQYIISDQVNGLANLHVYINNTLINSNNLTLVGRTLTLTANVANNDILTIDIAGGDYNKFTGKQIFGSNTGASAIVEKYKRIYDKGQFYNELTITDISKAFIVGENAFTFWVDDVNNVSIKIAVPITSSVIDVEIVDGGSLYNIGDPLIFTSNTGAGAQAYVATIYRSGIRSVEVLQRGAGFIPGMLFNIIGGGGTGAAILLNGVDTSGNTHPNTYNVTSDIIHTYANTPLNSANYGFPAFANGNVNTLLSQAFSYQTYGLCGPIDPTEVLIIAEGQDYLTTPEIILDSPVFEVNVAGNTANIAMTDFGILGAMVIYNAGQNYAIGDEVIFTNAPSTTGQDAAAAVTKISATGGIAKIDFQPPRIGGTANVVSGSNVVVGLGTNFVKDVTPNARIMINCETQMVQSIINANTIITYNTWTYSANNRKVGVYGRNFIGGSGYHMGELPTATVQSVAGTGANVSVNAVIGDGELLVSSLQPIGRIKTVKVSQGGHGYLSEPSIDMSATGDGTANLIAQIAGGMFQYPGIYKNEDGFISGSNKLHDRDFYQFYSYVIQSKNTLDKYETTLRELVHPVGLKYFAEVDSNVSIISSNISMLHYDVNLDYKYVKLTLFGQTTTSKLQYSFYAPLTSSIVPSVGNNTPSFVRNSVATVQNHYGQIVTVLNGEARFKGARRVRNSLTTTSEDFSNAAWGKTTLNVTITTATSPPPGVKTVCLASPNTGATDSVLYQTVSEARSNITYAWTAYLKSATGSNTSIRLILADETFTILNSGNAYIVANVTSSWQRFFLTGTTSTGHSSIVGVLGGNSSWANGNNIYVAGAMLEDITGQLLIPSEYVSVGVESPPYHGANVDGVQYFEYDNGNYSVGKVLTETAGPPIGKYNNGLAFINNNNGTVVSYFYTANTANNQTPTDIDGRVKFSAKYSTLPIVNLLSRDSNNGGTRNWSFQATSQNGPSTLRFFYTPDGASARVADATIGLSSFGVSDNIPITVRFTYQANTGNVNFYASYDGNTWLQIGNTITLVSGPVYNTVTQATTVGAANTSGAFPLLDVPIYRAQLYSGINGTLIADFNPSDYNSGSSFISSNTSAVPACPFAYWLTYVFDQFIPTLINELETK